MSKLKTLNGKLFDVDPDIHGEVVDAVVDGVSIRVLKHKTDPGIEWPLDQLETKAKVLAAIATEKAARLLP